MKKLVLALTLALVFSAVWALKFDPDWFESKTIIGCFTKDAIPNIDGKLEFTFTNGVVNTGLKSFDALCAKYHIVDMKQMHPYVKVPTWNNDGAYLQNHYRIYLDSDEMMDAAVAELSKDPNFVYAEFETINRQKFVPDDPMLSQQYTHPRIQSFEAWDYSMGSRDVIVSITDSGVKWNHPDLRANIWINPAESAGMTLNYETGTITGGNGQDAGEGGNKIDDVVGWDFVSNDNNPMQTNIQNEHGTHVAGCAGAMGDNGIGVVGTSPLVSILCCKGAPENTVSTGVQYGYDQIKYSAEVGAHIINASWGGPGAGAYPTTMVNYATNLGALVVVASGNENLEHGTAYQDYPGDVPNAFNVSATNNGDIKTSFSDYGEPIDICAPGEGILSTVIANNSYESMNGTSMSSPIVAGVVALVKALHPDYTPQQLVDRVMYTSDPIDDLNPEYAGKLGAGRINSFTATMYDKIPNVQIGTVNTSDILGDNDGVCNPGETITMNVTLSNAMTGHGVLWKDAANLTATLSCNYPGVSIIDSEATYGTLFAGDSNANSTPFKFSTVSTLPSEPIPFQLDVSANESTAYPFHKTIPFTVELSLVQSGWPVNAGGAASSSPILVNVNSNEAKELVFGDQLGMIHLVDIAGASIGGGFPMNVGANVVGSIAMSNLQNNGYHGFAACLSNSKIIAFNSQAELLWEVPSEGNLRSGAVIATLTSVAEPRVIAATQNGKLIILDSAGNHVNSSPITLGGAFLASPTVADLNNDGVLEIILCSLTGTLHAINPITGQNISGFPVTLEGGSQNPITVANLDSDGFPEILIATSSSGYLYAINHDGSTLFRKNIGSQIKSGAVIADVDNNNSQEIILIAANGNIFIMDSAGNDLNGTPIALGVNVESTPVVARFDGVDNAGIIFGDSSGMLHSLRKDGTESPNFPIPISGNLRISAALDDIDNDGDMDIAVPNNTGYYVIDIKRPAQSILWGCFTGSYNRAGNIYQTTPNQDDTIVETCNALYNAIPNPFNPKTTICFEVKDNSPVMLNVYNQRGQLVRKLINGAVTKGINQIVWDGKDDNGNSVSSGIYYCRMQSGDFTSTKKMVMMK